MACLFLLLLSLALSRLRRRGEAAAAARTGARHTGSAAASFDPLRCSAPHRPEKLASWAALGVWRLFGPRCGEGGLARGLGEDWAEGSRAAEGDGRAGSCGAQTGSEKRCGLPILADLPPTL